MKRLLMVLGLIVVLSVGGGWSMMKWAPWWRVEGIDELEGVQVKFSRVRLAWVLGQLGVWEKGVSVKGEWQVPEKVVFIVNANKYDRDKFIDVPSSKMLYGAYDEFVGGKELMISVGLPNTDFLGEPRKISSIVNNQVLMTMMRLLRNKIISSPGSFMIESQIVLQRLPKQIVNTMISTK